MPGNFCRSLVKFHAGIEKIFFFRSIFKENSRAARRFENFRSLFNLSGFFEKLPNKVRDRRRRVVIVQYAALIGCGDAAETAVTAED